MRLAEESTVKRNRPDRHAGPDNWKKAVPETLLALGIIPAKFTGRVVVTFKEGGVSYLEKTETFK
jgi:hypothetical protein